VQLGLILREHYKLPAIWDLGASIPEIPKFALIWTKAHIGSIGRNMHNWWLKYGPCMVYTWRYGPYVVHTGSK
jgi:hypothetical protein